MTTYPGFMRVGTRAIALARRSPYGPIPGFMQRSWLLGADNPRRNDDSPSWKSGAYVPRQRSQFYYWTTDRLAIRIHKTLRSDADPFLHSHPFHNLSVVLRGGYWEVMPPTVLAQRCPEPYAEFLDLIARTPPRLISPEMLTDGMLYGVRWRGPGAVVARRAGDFHRLILPRNSFCWSLFVIGAKVREWTVLVNGREHPGKQFYKTQYDAARRAPA